MPILPLQAGRGGAWGGAEASGQPAALEVRPQQRRRQVACRSCQLQASLPPVGPQSTHRSVAWAAGSKMATSRPQTKVPRSQAQDTTCAGGSAMWERGGWVDGQARRAWLVEAKLPRALECHGARDPQQQQASPAHAHANAHPPPCPPLPATARPGCSFHVYAYLAKHVYKGGQGHKEADVGPVQHRQHQQRDDLMGMWGLGVEEGRGSAGPQAVRRLHGCRGRELATSASR